VFLHPTFRSENKKDFKFASSVNRITESSCVPTNDDPTLLHPSMSNSDPYRLPTKPTIIPVRTLKQNPDLLQTPVAQISIIGTETSEADSVFHFRMSLVLSDKKVIRLDASPAFTDPSHMSRGYVLLEYDPELEPAGPAVFTVKVAHPEVTLTAAHICKVLFNDNAQDQYE
jgi:hypothetical protein